MISKNSTSGRKYGNEFSTTVGAIFLHDNMINKNMKKVVLNPNQDKPQYICAYEKQDSLFVGTTSDGVTCNVVQPSNDFVYLVQSQ
jgi:hypothetical protein